MKNKEIEIEITLGKEERELIDKIKELTGETDDKEVIGKAINYVYEKDGLKKNRRIGKLFWYIHIFTFIFPIYYLIDYKTSLLKFAFFNRISNFFSKCITFYNI